MSPDDRRAAYRLTIGGLLIGALAMLFVPADECGWPIAEVLASDSPCGDAAAGRVAIGVLLLIGAAVVFGAYLVGQLRDRDGS